LQVLVAQVKMGTKNATVAFMLMLHAQNHYLTQNNHLAQNNHGVN
jgi:hypothetical protein